MDATEMLRAAASETIFSVEETDDGRPVAQQHQHWVVLDQSHSQTHCRQHSKRPRAVDKLDYLSHGISPSPAIIAAEQILSTLIVAALAQQFPKQENQQSGNQWLDDQ